MISVKLDVLSISVQIAPEYAIIKENIEDIKNIRRKP